MAPRRSRPGEARIAFDGLSIEGGLLGAEWLGKVAQLDATAQKPADYHVPEGLHVRDEIARSWRIGQACFRKMESGRASGGDARALAERFLEAFLRDAFGFTSLAHAEPTTIDERVYPVRFFTLGDRVPIVSAPAGAGLDTPLPELGDDRRRRSAFGLLQETLNASGAALWGLATDGLSLRIARDNASLTRPAWIEADLGRIFTEDLYPDFAALWLLAHESRFGRADDPPESCPLEVWREVGRQEGTRARDKLSDGFRQALEILGQGFLSHAANRKLRAALHAGVLTREHYFGQLLRLVYRLVFLLTVEERELLHPRDASDSACRLYAEGYGLRRLRDRAVRASAHDAQGDLWEAVRIVFRSLADGEPRLGLPALAGLFAPDECPDLDAARLENRALLGALFHLAWLRERSGLVRVNWRDMGPDELGYVYEGLLELVPQITGDGRSFSFAGAAESQGHERKTTGSYYTPDELVQVLLTSALDPVVERTVDAHPEDAVDALLELTIVDPACGSGHFLLAAARRLADRIAHIRAGGTPTPDDYQHALRDVVRRCIYGVDMNPLAVEICKVGLWMESIDPGLPLTFLESHIRCGNSLIGTSRALMGDEVPDAAWTVLEGDDRKVTRALKRLNKEELRGQQRLEFEPRSDIGTLHDRCTTLSGLRTWTPPLWRRNTEGGRRCWPQRPTSTRSSWPTRGVLLFCGPRMDPIRSPRQRPRRPRGSRCATRTYPRPRCSSTPRGALPRSSAFFTGSWRFRRSLRKGGSTSSSVTRPGSESSSRSRSSSPSASPRSRKRGTLPNERNSSRRFRPQIRFSGGIGRAHRALRKD